MTYVTALYAPEMYASNATRRFIGKGLANINQKIADAIPLLRRSRAVLGHDLLIMVDPSMANHPVYKIGYQKVVDSDVGALKIDLEHGGFWRRKWHAMLAAGQLRGWPLIWFDFLDAEVIARFTPDEQQFLAGRELVIEFERFRCFGPAPHNADGSVVPDRIRQPHTCIYQLGSPRLALAALDTKIDHDQIALMHALEKDGIFQDTEVDKVLTYSSNGLFATRNKQPVVGFKMFKPKIIHKNGK